MALVRLDHAGNFPSVYPALLALGRPQGKITWHGTSTVCPDPLPSYFRNSYDTQDRMSVLQKALRLTSDQ